MQNKLTNGLGLRITIENSTKIPFIVSEGVNVRPRTSTNIGLVETKHNRLSEPYPSNCSDEYPIKFKHLDNFTRFAAYSSSMCRHVCYMDMILKHCKCFFPFLEGNIPFDPAGKRFCNMDPDKSNADLTCLDQLLVQGADDIQSLCNCNPECHETSYKVKFKPGHLSVVTNS